MEARVWIKLALAIAVISICGCEKKDTTVKQQKAKPEATPEAKEIRQMRANRESFGKTPDGKQVDLYTLTNISGIRARITSFGAILVSLQVPDRRKMVILLSASISSTDILACMTTVGNTRTMSARRY
jgi:hypothetical protein